MIVREFAPAKVNLCLHITGRREDSYHLLDSLVAFADIGDDLTLRAAQTHSLDISGPYAGALRGETDNLISRAAAALGDRAPAASIELLKRLPVAGGIGGGSANAAAALRGLLALAGDAAPGPEELSTIALALGADVPACLVSRALRMRGIGEQIEMISPLPLLPAVLVNPSVPVPTGPIFKALNLPTGESAFSEIGDLPADGFADAGSLGEWLRERRNDLQPPARDIVPEVGEVLKSISNQTGCHLARMSGSGATCFGLFADEDQANVAAASIGKANPDWWSVPTKLS